MRRKQVDPAEVVPSLAASLGHDAELLAEGGEADHGHRQEAAEEAEEDEREGHAGGGKHDEGEHSAREHGCRRRAVGRAEEPEGAQHRPESAEGVEPELGALHLDAAKVELLVGEGAVEVVDGLSAREAEAPEEGEREGDAAAGVDAKPGAEEVAVVALLGLGRAAGGGGGGEGGDVEEDGDGGRGLTAAEEDDEEEPGLGTRDEEGG